MEVIKYLAKLFTESKNLYVRLSAFISIVAMFLIIDNCTSFLSLSFTNSKYEAIERLNNIYKDSSYSKEIRFQAKNELDVIVNTHNIRHYYLPLLQSFRSTSAVIEHIKPPVKRSNNEKIMSFRFIFNNVWYVIMSSGIWVSTFLYVLIGLLRNKKQMGRKPISLILSFTFFILILVPLFVMICNFSIKLFNTNRIYTTALLTQIVITMIIGHTIGLLMKLKIIPNKTSELNNSNKPI